jgi:hypothetical protein
MRPRAVVRPVLKWAGTVVCVLLVAVFAVSMRYQVDWKNRDASVHLSFWAGHIIFNSYGYARPKASDPGWKAFRIQAPDPFWRRAAVPFRPLGVYWSGGRVSLQCPLWVPFVLGAATTAVLWWRDRRRIPQGHCRKCGYDLTGNVSGRCPECGTIIAPGGR